MAISKLKLMRLDREMTMYDLAKKTSIAQAYISYFERGLKEPNNRQEKALAKALKCKVGDIF